MSVCLLLLRILQFVLVSYYAMQMHIVIPHFEYCIQAWMPYLRKYIDMLETTHRMATKPIPGLTDLRHEARIQ